MRQTELLIESIEVTRTLVARAWQEELCDRVDPATLRQLSRHLRALDGDLKRLREQIGLSLIE